MQSAKPEAALPVTLGACAAFVAAVLLAEPYLAAQVDPVLESAKSVLKIEATFADGKRSQGSGFVWRDARHAVTALHVVAGAQTIRVISDYKDNASVPARLELENLTADLAVLQLGADLGLKPLTVSVVKAAVEHPIWGFPINVEKAMNSMVRFAVDRDGKPNATFSALFSKRDFERVTGTQPYPRIDAQIMRASGGLTHGYSGAPIMDLAGNVVAVGDGGLKEGLGQVNWAIAAAPYLMKEPAGFTPGGRAPRASASEFMSAVVETREVAGVPADGPELRLAWSASIADILGTLPEHSDTELSLDDFDDLLEDLGRKELASMVDVYVDAVSGATFAVPAAMELEYDDGFITGMSDSGNVSVFMQVHRGEIAGEGLALSRIFMEVIGERADWKPYPGGEDLEFNNPELGVHYRNISRVVPDRTSPRQTSRELEATVLVHEPNFIASAVDLKNAGKAPKKDLTLFNVLLFCVKLAAFGGGH